MDHLSRISLVKLDQEPCVVSFLECHNRYLVGTYHLYQDIESYINEHKSQLPASELKPCLDKINNRSGKLIILKDHHSLKSKHSLVEYEHICDEGGGVFDAKVRYKSSDTSYEIYVAHANGSIGIYNLSFNNDLATICLMEHLVVPDATMLTSIDFFPQAQGSSKSRFVVGDDCGNIHIISNDDKFGRDNVGPFCPSDPVWQVKSLKISTDSEFAIATTERNAWIIYKIDEISKSLIKTYENSDDFGAGVTSITLLGMSAAADHDLIRVVLGSYDGSLKTYLIKIYHDGIRKPDVDRLTTIAIKDGGIWRMRLFNTGDKSELAIAAMYAGCHTYTFSLDLNKSESPEDSLKSLVDPDLVQAGSAKTPLYYDIGISKDKETFCIADFNNRTCLVKTRLQSAI